MDKSQTPLRKWLLAIHLMGTDKRGCSAMRLKRELRISYDTAWTMTHKIRNALKERDGNYQLYGFVEIDKGFFGSPSKGEGKRGRGTDKALVVVGLSLDEQGRPEYIKAQVLETVDSDSLVGFATVAVEEGSTVSSDGLPAYNKLAEHGFEHQPVTFNPVDGPGHLKWLHVVISNMKAFLNGTYHGVPKKHLQAFIDEFCYRFNRRFWPGQLFARTVCACVDAAPYTRYELIG